MDFAKASDIFSKSYPDYKIVGYWVDEPDIIVATKTRYSAKMPAPAQFVISDDGRIVPTNPVLRDLNIANMHLVGGGNH